MPLEPEHALFRCRKCVTRQLVYVGDPDDYTIADVDAVECFQCGAVEVVNEWPGDICGDPFTRKGKPLT